MTNREDCLLAYKHKTPSHIPCFFTDIALIQAAPQMERYTGLTAGEDYWGCHWTYEDTIHACAPTPNRYLFTEIEDWKDHMHFPDLEAIDWEKQAEIDVHSDFIGFVMGYGLNQLPDGKSAFDDDRIHVCMILNGMFERMHACMGFENALCALMEDPDSCKEFFHAVADWKIAYIKKIAQYYDIDVINAHDDYGTKDRLFMSLDLWRELIKPELARIVEATHECGMIYQHHSCGYVEPLLEDLIEIGVDAIDTLQGGSNPNLAELKAQYGDKLTFCGGFDTQGVLDFPGVTPEEVKTEYRKVIDDLAPHGSYVVYPIGGTFEFVPAFLEAHFTYGMGFYANPANR